jgi:hypothetical protein
MHLATRLSRLETWLLLRPERLWRVYLTVPRPVYSLAEPCPEHRDCLVRVNGPLEMHLAHPPDGEGPT